MSGEDQGNGAASRIQELLRIREAATSALEDARRNGDTAQDRVRELEARIEAIDAEVEQIELAAEIERQSDA